MEITASDLAATDLGDKKIVNPCRLRVSAEHTDVETLVHPSNKVESELVQFELQDACPWYGGVFTYMPDLPY